MFMEQQESMGVEQSINSRYSFWVREALDDLPHCFTITDPWISGQPIVFASRELLKMSGYSKEEVIGRNGRMFQGSRTNRRSVLEIREAVRQERSIQVTILNYHKTGTPFWILFHMFPVFSKEDGRLIHFIGVQVPITTPRPRSVSLCDKGAEGGSVLGFCRREVCSDTVGRIPNLEIAPATAAAAADDTTECKASDLEKEAAKSAMGNILSMLTHYSQLTGRLVSDERCYMGGVGVGVSLNISLARIRQSFVLTDPHKADIPIVYASDAFLELTGYSRHEVLGQSCRFLSGQETDVSAESQITNSIRTGKACTVCILNYRKDGSPFWNSLHISPVRNASGKTAYFVEVQMNVNHESKNVRPEMMQLSVVGAVKVAVRTLGIASNS